MLGILGKYQALATVKDNHAGMRARNGLPHETLPGVWWFGTGQAPPPGLTKLKLRTYDNAMPRTAVVLNCPAARPSEAIIAGGRPAARTPDGKLADQVALIRWLGQHLYTDGWGARHCAAYLAAHGWAPHGLRRRRPIEIHRTLRDGRTVDRVIEPPAVRLRADYAGRNDVALKADQVDALRTNAANRPDAGALVTQQQRIQLFKWFPTVAALREKRAAHPSRLGSTAPPRFKPDDLYVARRLLRDITAGWIRDMHTAPTAQHGEEPPVLRRNGSWRSDVGARTDGRLDHSLLRIPCRNGWTARRVPPAPY